MMRVSRFLAAPLMALAAPLALSGCFGGAKVPPTLLTLTPDAAAPATIARSASAGEAVTIDVPVVAKELRSIRVPVQVRPSAIAYVKGAQWVDTPDRLFQKLLAETITRTTGRVVLDPRQASLDPGLHLTGQLHRFGYDAATGAVVASYDGALSTTGGTRVETRRFTASVASSSDAGAIGPALNQAANQIAAQVALWVGG